MANLLIPSKNNEGTHNFATQDIIRCEASSNYTWFYLTNNRKFLSSQTMGNFENSLIENDFIRIHRKNIINKLFISKIEKCGTVKLLDGTFFKTSRRRRKIIGEIMLSELEHNNRLIF